MIDNLIVEEKHVPLLVRFVENFLGVDELDQRIQEVERALQCSSKIVREHWVVPTYAVWIGLRELRTGPRRWADDPRKLPIARVSLEFAAVLKKLAPSLPNWKRDEFRNRLLSKGPLMPVLIEMMTAVHYLIRGFQLDWVNDGSKQGRRTPEMVVRWSGGEFEIECKAHGIDSGRKIPRRAFCELCDTVDTLLESEVPKEMEVEIHVSVQDRLDTSAQFKNTIARAILQSELKGSETMPAGVAVRLVRRLAHRVSSELTALEALQRRVGEFDHSAIIFRKIRGQPFQRFLITCESIERDHIVKSIERRLKDACGQLSRNRPARIVCYIPEVSSFDILKSGSAIQIMTHRFFAGDRRWLHSVVYVSDAVAMQLSGGLQSLTQGLTFTNPKFSGHFPEDILETRAMS